MIFKSRFNISYSIYWVTCSVLLFVNECVDSNIVEKVGISLFTLLVSILFKDVLPNRLTGIMRSHKKDLQKRHIVIFLLVMKRISMLFFIVSSFIAGLGVINIIITRSNAAIETGIVFLMILPVWLCVRRGVDSAIYNLEIEFIGLNEEKNIN